jgi:N-acetylmuramoyl-L-alanine amidase
VIAGLALAAPAARAAQAAVDEEGPVLQLNSDLRVRVHRGRDITLEVRIGPDAGYGEIARRVSGDAALGSAIAAWNDNREPSAGEWARVPLVLLSPDYRALVLLDLFPGDRRDGRDWIHVTRGGLLATYDEGLWQVAEWFTGSGDTFQLLLEANGLDSPELRPGQEVRIPEAILHPAFKSRMTSDVHAELEYDRDSEGPFASYRLKAGEAVYSAVIVRFTGRTDAEDVNRLASELQARSGIPDLRDIPVGYRIKIPLDLLEPEFLPRGHPRRLAAEAERAELARVLAQQPLADVRSGLEGVLVILDPGHGGRDLGTSHNGIWEHDYVYDVTCRLKDKLEAATAARVELTLEDLDTGCVPSATDALVANQQGTILTRPRFLATEPGEAKIGVNLRWYLANSIYRDAVARGMDADRIVFLSLHADSRHPSLRGVMVYVPGAAYRTRTYGHSSATYARYDEVREKPHVRFSKKQRVRSEAVSRRLADSIVESFDDHGLAVQDYQPVRHRIIRGSKRYIPAVLRGNAVPTKVLVEMVNLGNAEDAAVLGSSRDRDRLADAVFQALLRHFGEPSRDTAELKAAP